MGRLTPEGRVKKIVTECCQTRGAYIFMPVQNGMGRPGLDYHGCFYGRAFFIETKAPGKKPTERQKATISSCQAAGGKCFVIDGAKSLQPLVKWFNEVEIEMTLKGEKLHEPEQEWDRGDAGERTLSFDPD